MEGMTLTVAQRLSPLLDGLCGPGMLAVSPDGQELAGFEGTTKLRVVAEDEAWGGPVGFPAGWLVDLDDAATRGVLERKVLRPAGVFIAVTELGLFFVEGVDITAVQDIVPPVLGAIDEGLIIGLGCLALLVDRGWCSCGGICPDCNPEPVRKKDPVPEGCEECPGCPDCLEVDR